MEMTSLVLKTEKLDVVISLNTRNDPTDSEWAEYLLILEGLTATGGDDSRVRNFIVSDGGSPNRAQRAQLARDFSKRVNPVVVICNALSNPIKRGLATVVRWMFPGLRVFGPRDWKAALEHANCTDAEEQILLALIELQRSMPEIRTLTELSLLGGRARPEFGLPRFGATRQPRA